MSDEVDIAACWRSLEDLADLVSRPGQIQVQCAADPKFGPLLEETGKKLFEVLWKVTDFGSKISEEDQHKVSELAVSINSIYGSFLAKRFSVGADAMQKLPPESLFMEIRPPESATGVSKEAMSRFEAQVAGLSDSEGKKPSLVAGKLKPSLNTIMTAGMLAAGGQEEFAKLQLEVIESVPEHFRAHTNIMITSQFIGATLKAMSRFSCQKNMVMASIMGCLEALMAARRMAGIGYAGVWGQSANSATAMISAMMLEGINRSIERENVESSEDIAKDIIENMVKKANMPGNGTIN